jgi:DNA-binding response OmpR family regulator
MTEQEPNDRGARHVLVVEDDDLVGMTIVAMLEGVHHAALAVDVAAALGVLDSAEPVEVILLDCLLPGGGVTRLLGAADDCGVPVILISGSSAEIGRIDDSRPSLHKPFSADEMLRLISIVAPAR